MIIVYLVLTVGCKMFIDSYTNSRNRLMAEKICPVMFSSEDGKLSIEILGKRRVFEMPAFVENRGVCFSAYVLMPDDIRTAVLLFSDFRA